MIKYSENTINNWYYSSDNIIKVYRNNAICYYKIDSSSPSGQTPCFAVVADISQYSDTEFDDVFNKADGKWYKLNNLNQYEEYGVYGSGRTITTYEGKLTIDTESTPQPSRLPAGYTEVEYIRQNSNYDAYINTGVILFDNTSNTYTITTRLTSEFHSNLGCATIINCERVNSPYDGLGYRYKCSSTVDELEFFGGNPNYSSSSVDNGDGTRTITFTSTGNSSFTTDVPLSYFASFSSTTYGTNSTYRYSDATIYSASIVKNGITVRDFVPAKRDSDSVYGLYDLITDTFYTSPNGNNFSGGSEVIQPPITATCEFIYSGNSWVNVGEVSGGTASLPNIPFVLNYNAKNYDATTHSIPMTTGQLNDTDAVAVNSPNNIVDHSADGYITVSNSSMRIRKQGQDISLFNRQSISVSSDLTIVCKAKSTNGENIITNRDSNYNWMYRLKTSGILTFHGNSETGGIAWNTSNPDIMSVRTYDDSGTKIKYNNWTQNTSTSPTSFSYGSTNTDNSAAGALFVGYSWTNTNEQWGGDFYWAYMAQANLTDAQIQEVINYNEGGGGQSEYPIYYDEMQDPPNNLSFSSMTEAEEYECPWVGMSATIDGDNYVFSGDAQSGYEWVYNSSRLPVGYTEVEYIQNTSHAYLDIGFIPNQDTRIVCDMQQVTENDFPRLWGAGEWNSANGINLNYEGGYLQMSWFGKTSWTKFTSVPTNNDRHTYDLNKNYLYVDETLVGSNTYTTKTAAASIGIFCEIRNNGQPPTSGNNPQYWEGEYFKGKIYSFQVYNNGTLARDLVPCVRDNDNKAGAYDLVNDVFYTVPTGYTTDTLIAGNPV